jgi:transcriptional regulator with XRE-family HTH domain
MINAAQIRAARHLLSLSQVDIAEAIGLSLPTIKSAESDREVSFSADALAAIQRALESAGVEFTDGAEPGVTLKGKGADNRSRGLERFE